MGYGNWTGFGYMWIFPLLFLAVCIYFMRGMNRNPMHLSQAANLS